MDYNWLKAFHIFSVICWMAGLFYFPRLLVYHCRASLGGELDKTLKIQEIRLRNIIMTPALIFTWIFGVLLIVNRPEIHREIWFSIKFLLVIILSGYHGYLIVISKKFQRGERPKSEKYFRIINEIPTLLVFIIVILAVIKPF